MCFFIHGCKLFLTELYVRQKQIYIEYLGRKLQKQRKSKKKTTKIKKRNLFVYFVLRMAKGIVCALAMPKQEKATINEKDKI